MSIETTFDHITDLSVSNPAATDGLAQADDHLRGIKKAVRDTFSGIRDQGNKTAVTSTAAELNILDGATLTTSELNILDGVTSTATELNVLDGIPATLTAAELGYVDGVTSAIQTQMDTKAPLASPTFTGTASAVTQISTDNSTKIATTEFVKDALTAAFSFDASTGVLTITTI